MYIMYCVSGIYDYVKGVSPDSVLIGFADGPKGVFTGRYFEVVRASPLMRGRKAFIHFADGGYI